MNYLEEFNYSEDTIKNIEDSLSNDDYIEFSFNQKRVLEDIAYLNSLGIKNIDKLIIERPSLFYEDKDTLEEYFNKCTIPNIVDLINIDNAMFEEIGL